MIELNFTQTFLRVGSLFYSFELNRIDSMHRFFSQKKPVKLTGFYWLERRLKLDYISLEITYEVILRSLELSSIHFEYRYWLLADQFDQLEALANQ